MNSFAQSFSLLRSEYIMPFPTIDNPEPQIRYTLQYWVDMRDFQHTTGNWVVLVYVWSEA